MNLKAHFSVFFCGFSVIFCLAALLIASRLPGLTGMEPFFLSILLLIPPVAAALFFKSCEKKYRLLCTLACALLLLLRLCFFPRETSDFTDFLRPWTEWLRANGHFRGLGLEIGNYNVPYMVLLSLFSCFRMPELYLIKYSSLLFDMLQAFSLYGIVFHISRSQGRGCAAFVIALLLPTVVINSAVWGQCDSVYVSLGLLALWLCMSGRSAAAMIALGFSFAFKLQAVFLIPAFFPLLLQGKLKWRSLPLFPAAYLLAVSPAVFAGRSLRSVLLFYVSSASTAGSSLNYNSSSVFSLPFFYGISSSDRLSMLGICLAALFCVSLCFLFLIRRKHITDRSVLLAALVFCCGIPLFLPHMHERYFYFCDLLTLALACSSQYAAPVVLCSQFASLLGYYAYFHQRYLLPMRYGCYALIFTLVYTLVLLWEALHPKVPGVPASVQ